MATERPWSEAEIAAGLRGLGGKWVYQNGALRRTYPTDGWRGSLLVANAIGFLCEAADHHADVLVTWPRVEVALATHSAGGITGKDFEVAGLIEAQIRWKPPAGSSLRGPPTPFVKD
jgi:4a-hydroxytetrahydrobiopterin dehydratase